ncbi:MAG: type II toxin-antitoxin system RatA family toxin [Pseudomonadota bacterium]
MPLIKRSALINCSASQMYALVDDIPAYPQFLPWCKSAHEHARNEDEVQASLEIARGGFQRAFTTQNRLQKDKIIEMRLVEGPFKHLQGFWRFEPLDEGACKVSLDIEFEFNSRLLALTLGPIFGQICNSLVDAFLTRAKVVYGGQDQR